jgi:siroheme synthase-like protein
VGFYPAFIDLRGRRCVVVGGGAIAEQKIRALLEAGADVVLIAAHCTEVLEQLASEGRIGLRRRPYRRGDLADAFLAIVADAGRQLRAAIWREAEAERVLLNSVDDVRHCHFIAPAIHRQGDLAVAISTGGKSPALAVRLRDRIGTAIGPEYAPLLELLGELRPAIAAAEPDAARRTVLWYRLVDLDLAEDVKRHGVDAARLKIRAALDAWAKTRPMAARQ